MNWRADYPVLIADSQAMGSIGVIRSLGRAGYPVHACSQKADALGLRSNYASRRTVCPRYDSKDFVSWLREYVREHDIRAIVPSEGMLLALRSSFDEFSGLFPLSRCADTVYAGMSKFDLFQSFQKDAELQIGIPPTMLIDDPDRILSLNELTGLGVPLYVKADAVYSKNDFNDSAVQRCDSAAGAHEIIRKFSRRYSRFLVQGHVQGHGVGAFFLIWNGELIAEFMHRRLHEVPHTGGVSSLRESWFHQEIRSDALKKITSLGWQGVAMMEYRWDPKTDRFYLMEMNGRFWGSIHLALYAGVDFPKLLVDAFHGRTQEIENEYRRNLYCRHTVPKEFEYVWSRLKDPRLSWKSKVSSCLEFVALSVNPLVYSDLSFPGDRKLYWAACEHFAADLFGKRSNKMNSARIKRSFLYGCKLLGLFGLARRMTSQGLRILCYHGFASGDACEFRPKLFINLDTFRTRLEFLRKQGYPVVTLKEALAALEQRKTKGSLTVITIDDGFFSVQRAWQKLRNYGFPATLYVTSYYCSKRLPIFRLVVQYLFWKTDRKSLSPSEYLPFPNTCPLSTAREKEQAAWKVIDFGEQRSSESERWTIISELSENLGIDSGQLVESRELSLLNPQEISKLANEGLDIQLHSHRHRELTDGSLVENEINDNRTVLEPLVGGPLRHFCYPSGIWSRSLWPMLTKLQIESATTCEAGLNFPDTPRLALHRFLDGENISQIEFEAEMAGFVELLRRARSALKNGWFGTDWGASRNATK
jgi:predicted ATP-grasp superfamily ATP-dependent carboligase/peptidoglycan/xylan/chitin deacetylase (PgdA/CDA1 family)